MPLQPTLTAMLLLLLPLMSMGSAQPQPYILTPGEACFRECADNDVRTCHFNFEVHQYQTLSRACYNCPSNASDCGRPHCAPGDGVKRQITVVNRQMPGPLIQVCLGDRIVVDVHNSLSLGVVTLHWHGLTMKAYNGSQGTPYMDGSPGVTQCPILPGQDFRYDIIATEAGTQWWHAHTGFQRGDGLYGGLIVREPKDPHQQLYDYDLTQHTILIDSWLHIPAEDKHSLRMYGGDNDFADSLLINGRGPHQSPVATELSRQIPYTRFKVNKGARYRLRLINVAALNCPTTFSIDEHPFTAITTDGNPIEPVNTSSLVIYPGERWDIIVSTNATSGTYWMSFMGDIKCAKATPAPAHQFALFEYTDLQPTDEQPDEVVLAQMKTKPEFTVSVPPGVQINSMNKDYYADEIGITDLRSLSPLPRNMAHEKADFTLYLAFQMLKINNKHYYDEEYYPFNEMPGSQQKNSGQINNITLKLPVSPLLTSGQGMPICNAESPPDASMCHDDYCECLHMYKLPLDATVDLVFIDEGETGSEQNHPIHMHGYRFWVLAEDILQDGDGTPISRETVMNIDRKGLIERNLVNPVLKDSVKVPDGGYTVVRIKADNPGYWFLHCHLLFHSMGGMKMVLQVGDAKDLPPPPAAFQTCSESASMAIHPGGTKKNALDPVEAIETIAPYFKPLSYPVIFW